MIWDDLAYAYSSQGSGGTEDPVFTHEGWAEAFDGRMYHYKIETADGISASMTLNDKYYDLQKGSLFLVTVPTGASGEKTVINQLNHDLSGLTNGRSL